MNDNLKERPLQDDTPSFGGFKVVTGSATCGCTAPLSRAASRESLEKLGFVVGERETARGPVPKITHHLTAEDRFGAFKARWGVGRMNYTVPPGLYALGEPDADSEVLVTANYKLSFDKLRASLPGRNAWILVLDTFGINVWCAAGKGTFGTAELVGRIGECGLDEVVNHRRVVLPQLGAPGVAAHTVRKLSGFKVIYGPVRADDLPAFFDAGLKATGEMRTKKFPLSERAILIPVELVTALKAVALMAVCFFLLSGLGGPGGYWENALRSGSLAAAALLASLVGGTILFPLLLPWLPGRAFSFKSLPIGIGLAALAVVWRGDLSNWAGMLESGAWLLIVPALTAFLAMNFTGASTYTNLSGVKKEMRAAIPVQIAAAAFGLAAWIASRAFS